jgi:hypothetical protein
MVPITIIDNFFETPTLIREFGLSLPFSKSENGVCPGVRTDYIHNINPDFQNYLIRKVLSVFFNLDKEDLDAYVEFNFQQSYGKYEEGWIHQDSSYSQFAGVVYLTPEAPLEAGTSIHKIVDQCNYDAKQELKYLHYGDYAVDMKQVRDAREKNNSCFTKTLDIANIFNRALIYNADDWHKENKFFGDNKDNCRLTLLFFGNINTKGNSKTPLLRSKSISTY